jgi:hypothetical protein
MGETLHDYSLIFKKTWDAGHQATWNEMNGFGWIRPIHSYLTASFG